MRANVTQLSLIALLASASAGQANPEISNPSCVATEVKLVYNCQFDLLEDGQPVTDAEIAVGASMPSMPMAHNVKPVTSFESTEMPGQYLYDLELAMAGEWLVIFDISQPMRDRLQKKFMFNADGSVEQFDRGDE